MCHTNCRRRKYESCIRNSALKCHSILLAITIATPSHLSFTGPCQSLALKAQSPSPLPSLAVSHRSLPPFPVMTVRPEYSAVSELLRAIQWDTRHTYPIPQGRSPAVPTDFLRPPPYSESFHFGRSFWRRRRRFCRALCRGWTASSARSGAQSSRRSSGAGRGRFRRRSRDDALRGWRGFLLQKKISLRADE